MPSHPLEAARLYREWMKNNHTKRQADCARHFQVSREWVTRQLNLLKLSPEVQHSLDHFCENLKLKLFFTEKKLVPLLQMNEEELRSSFQKILEEAKGSISENLDSKHH